MHTSYQLSTERIVILELEFGYQTEALMQPWSDYGDKRYTIMSNVMEWTELKPNYQLRLLLRVGNEVPKLVVVYRRGLAVEFSVKLVMTNGKKDS